MALTVSPGQAVGQPDWDALAAQHGGVKSTSKVAPSQAQMADAGMGGDDDPSFQQRPIYRYYFNDGSYVDARTAQNGADYSIIEYKPSSQFTQSQSPTAQTQQRPTTGRIEGTPTGQKDANGQPIYDNTKPIMVYRDANGQQVGPSQELNPAQRQQWEREKNQSAGLGLKTDAEVAAANQPQTGESRLPVDNRPGWTKITRKKIENGNTTEVVTFLPPGKTAQTDEVSSLPEDNKPTSTILKPDGKGGTIAVQTMPDGSIRTTPLPGVPSEASSKYKEVKQDPNTGKWSGLTPQGTWEPIRSGPGLPGNQPIPEGMPRPSGKLGDAAADLEALDQWLEPQVRSGKLTTARADQIREQRRQFWQTAVSEQQGIVNAQSTKYGQDLTQRQQDLSDVQSRRNTAASVANQTESDWLPLATKLGAAPGAGKALVGAIRESRFDAGDLITQMGGNRTVAPVQPGPALGAVGGMPLPGGATGAAPAPQMAPGFNPRPNAIGLGGIGSTPAPGGVRPVFTPQPVAPAPVAPPPAVPVSPPVPAAAPVPNAGAGTGEPSSRGNIPSAAPSPTPVNPLPGQPGNDPTRPVGMIQPSPFFLAGSSRGHVYDPTPTIQAMIADPRYDNSVIRQVVAEEYPGYPIDDLLTGRAA